MARKSSEGSVRWPTGPQFGQFRFKLMPLGSRILNGSVLAIDPATISVGWAWFEKGELIRSGTILLPSTDTVGKRLQALYDILFKFDVPDIVAIELIQGAHRNDLVQYSIGSIMSAVRAPIFIMVPIPVWKAYSKSEPGYIKSDVADAEMIGKSLIAVTRGLYAADL